MKTVKLLALVLLLAPVAGWAQQKPTFGTFQEALQAGRALGGRNGPAGVVWIDGGRRFSFTQRGATGEVRISDYVGHRFRRMSDSDFGASRTPVSLDVGHLSGGGALDN